MLKWSMPTSTFTPAFKRTHGTFSAVASVVNRAVLEDLYNERGLEFNIRQALKTDKMPIDTIDENVSVIYGLVASGIISTKSTDCYVSA